MWFAMASVWELNCHNVYTFCSSAKQHSAMFLIIFVKHVILFFLFLVGPYSVLSFHDCSSDRLLDEQINIAVDTRDHLVSQRLTFKRLQTRINDISNRFPVVNSLLQRINFRKRRDSIILGLVIGICTILLLMYAFR